MAVPAPEIGKPAPNLSVSRWVQGMPTNLDQERDRIVVVEVFQVNCPGCFMYAIPEAIDVYKRHAGEDGVRVLGVATAFEDFEKNTLANLEMLAETGEVVGDTLESLGRYGRLRDGNRLPYKIPFPLAMDELVPTDGEPSTEAIRAIIDPQIPDFDSMPGEHRADVVERVRGHLLSKEYSARTFERYALRGTPSTIIVDRRGVLRSVTFGSTGGSIENTVRALLDE